MLLPLTLLFEEININELYNAKITYHLAILSVSLFGTIIGFGLWFYLLSRHFVADIAPFSLLVPIVGIGSSMLLLGERISISLIIGGSLTIIGIAIIIIRKPRFITRGASSA